MSSNSTNRLYLLQTAGENSGTWGLDPGLNGNFNKIDQNLGGVTTVALTSGSTVLTSTQYANGTIRLSGTLTGQAQVVFPAVQGWWTIENLTTGAFASLIVIVGAPGEFIAVEQGTAADILLDGTNVKFRNLPPVGTYLDVIDSTVPLWITSCSRPPYLICDGSVFSAVTYPYLNAKLGGTTLPDLRGRSRFYLDGGTGRITTAGSGIDGATRLAAGGAQNVVIAAGNVPQLAVSITDPQHSHNATYQAVSQGSSGGGIVQSVQSTGGNNSWSTQAASTGISATANTASANTALNKMPPACISGVTLIRAA